LKASCGVSYLSGSPEVVGETLIKLAGKEMAKVMVGDKGSKTIASVSLSNNTVHRRITDIAKYVKQQLLSLQCDKR
jgi:hypothetical protein